MWHFSLAALIPDSLCFISHSTYCISPVRSLVTSAPPTACRAGQMTSLATSSLTNQNTSPYNCTLFPRAHDRLCLPCSSNDPVTAATYLPPPLTEKMPTYPFSTPLPFISASCSCPSLALRHTRRVLGIAPFRLHARGASVTTAYEVVGRHTSVS